MALPPSTANWHWKNKNVTRWGQEWFEQELTVSVQDVSISKVTEVDGDIELGQRKSKLITIFDCKVVMRWSGKTTDGTDVTGTLTIPEVSHENLCDGSSELVYNWSLDTKASEEVNAVYALAKSLLPPAIKAKLDIFPAAIIETHGKDLTVSADASRSVTPAPASIVYTAAASSSGVTESAKSCKRKEGFASKAINSSTVKVEATFQASADDLFDMFTNEKKIPMWTRDNAGKSKLEQGGEYTLFGGGVRGKYISWTPSEAIKQTWSLQSPKWPEGHDAVMTISFDQSSDSTKVKMELSGVPIGMEDELRRNIEAYYIHGFKAIGYVQLVQAMPVFSSSYLEQKRRASLAQPKLSERRYISALAIALLILISALLIPLFSSVLFSSA